MLCILYHLALATPHHWNSLPRPVLPSRTLFNPYFYLISLRYLKHHNLFWTFFFLLFSTPYLTEFPSTTLNTCPPSTLLLKYLCFLSFYPWPSAHPPRWSHSSPGFSLQVDAADLPEICVSSPILPTKLSTNISSFWQDDHHHLVTEAQYGWNGAHGLPLKSCFFTQMITSWLMVPPFT